MASCSCSVTCSITRTRKKEEVRKERRQRDLIQALSEDYLLVCSFSLDTKAGEALRVSGDRLRKLDELFAGELNLDSCLGGYINEAVVEEDLAMLRDALSAESLITRLTDESRIHVNYRINHGDVTEYCQATVVRGGDWPKPTTWCWACAASTCKLARR